MKKKEKQKQEDFDRDFDAGKVTVDFSGAISTPGLSKMVKLPPIDIPAWLAMEIEKLAKLQGNSRSSVIRQLLSTALGQKLKVA
jgi:hypothetical protein